MARTPATVVADPQDTKSFSAFLTDLEDGQFDRDLSAELRAMIARLKHTHLIAGGKPAAKITVAFELTLIDGMMHVAKSFKTEPHAPRPTEVFYPTPKGTLTRNSPYVQEPLPMVKGSR